jgi:hypothetical protein
MINKFNGFSLWLLVFTISPVVWAMDSSPRSFYTDLKDCQVIEKGEEGRWSVRECPPQGGYQLFLHDADQKNWLVLKQANEVVINLRHDILNKTPGDFPKVPGPIEWRVQDESLIALIFEVLSEDQYVTPPEMKSQWFAIGLEGNKGCLLGITDSNEKAREMANSGC